MKKILLITLCFFITVNSFSQKSSTDFKHNISLSDCSSLLGLTTNMFIKDGAGIVVNAYASPIPHLSYTYKLTENFGVGITGTYQLFNFELSVMQMKIHRINPSLHLDYYIVTDDKIDVYGGGRIGYTIWTGNVTFSELRQYINSIIPSFVSNFIPQSFYNSIMPSDLKLFKTFVSYQAYVGTHIYITPNFGIKAEVAIGSPYWGLIGVNVRL